MTKISLALTGDQITLDLKKLNPEELKNLSDSLHFGLVTSLVDSLNRLDAETSQVTKMRNKLEDYLATRIEQDITNLNMDYETAAKLYQMFTNIDINVAEVKRKVFNGKALLQVDPLLKEERAFLDLLKVVNTKEKKQKVIDFINALNDFEFEEEAEEDSIES